MAVINLHLDGELMEFMENYIKRVYAASKAEVLRAGLRELKMKTPSEEGEGIGSFIAKNSNRGIWEDKKEDAVWNKY